MCNESMMHSFTDLSGNSLANGSRYTCWDTEQKVVPGAVPLEPGAGVLDETHRFIHGVAAFTNTYGSVEPVISTNLSAYADWITRFVLYRPPKVELVFRSDGDDFDFGSKCTLKNGTDGNFLKYTIRFAKECFLYRLDTGAVFLP
uniref:Uncharacterized protein n=1 Tax=Anopheles atroparvus TaxID=41427 RepID=A0A182J5Z9_ANOAO